MKKQLSVLSLFAGGALMKKGLTMAGATKARAIEIKPKKGSGISEKHCTKIGHGRTGAGVQNERSRIMVPIR